MCILDTAAPLGGSMSTQTKREAFERGLETENFRTEIWVLLQNVPAPQDVDVMSSSMLSQIVAENLFATESQSRLSGYVIWVHHTMQCASGL
jgi:hypothetical protein